MNDITSRHAWHPGFVAAAGIELKNEKGLTFYPEYNLSKEPLRIDLYIQQDGNQPVENEIGRIFKHYNIIEYKSPKDSLSIDDLFKTIGYACIFKGLGETVDKYSENEITVSIFRDTYPRDLFSYLKTTGRNIEEKYSGIYYISGVFPFPIQIVVTSRLSEKHVGLRILSNNAKIEDVKSFLEVAGKFTSPGDRHNAYAILQVSVSANPELYMDVRRDEFMCQALRDLMAEEIDNEVKNAEENLSRSFAIKLKEKGMDIAFISDAVGQTPEKIRDWLS